MSRMWGRFPELHGSNPVKWGWNIVCFNCGWETKQAEGLDIAQYCDLMEEVKSRVESISQLMALPGMTMRTRWSRSVSSSGCYLN